MINKTQEEKDRIVLVKYIAKTRKLKLKDFLIDKKENKDSIKANFVEEIITPTGRFSIYDVEIKMIKKGGKNK